jgi:cbb3-type cytochrome oxidase subunit 3
MERSRLWVLVASALAIAAILLLAAGLSSVELLPGRPLPRGEEQAQGGFFSGGGLPTRLVQSLIRIFGFIVLVLLPLALIYVIVSPEARRRVLYRLGLLTWLIALYLVLRANGDFLRSIQLEPPAAGLPAEGELPGLDFSASPTPALIWISTVGLALVLAGVLVAVFWLLWRRRRKPSTLAQLAGEARGALDALSAGADVEDTIMRSYFEMARILEQERGITRAEAMTPREFEDRLKALSLPAGDVEQLTRLFEAVRYGRWVAGEREKREAIACLMAIAESSRGGS